MLVIAGQVPWPQIGRNIVAVGMRTDDPMDLETLIPEALALDAPVVIDVPFGDLPIPRAPQIAAVYNQPWTQPQEGLIEG